ncbi:cytochrome c oxidase subunit II [Tropheryma whipplei]|uniref:cytochrome-c oxidase n=1 Tax=Tropheryma whipplei (strain Twist) TaxID=203267 RepID=Q83GL9_TROWT|nr:cytochrome c oxidase subunit II [Tropheryma whipplei]AAO44340.1 cytochrome c oxidase subunit II [Tropheryma whipplei str. Twist]MCO8182605.1 cytochrome c oxidase subunit II [Tropheryma whipplei]MCO8190262.1 cytochrome c oxidase subunit II [Tropheryma whipplei]CAD67194.1 putative cytochrome c oxidase subunit II [Tropheryma whipplei TW08/27]
MRKFLTDLPVIRPIRSLLVVFVLTLSLVFVGCTTQQMHGFLPGFVEGESSVTETTQVYSDLWFNAWFVLIVIGILVWAMVVVAVVVFRRKRSDTTLPPQVQYNLPVETLLTGLPLILVAVFFVFSIRVSDAVNLPKPADVHIGVIGKQWAWDFVYFDSNTYFPGLQAQYIESSPGKVDESKLPVLYLPVNKKVEIDLRSRDVVHSFWIIDFLYKRDIVPGLTNRIYFTPTRIGEYRGKCAEFCGEFHSAMLFVVKVVTQEEYKKHMADLAGMGYIGTVGWESLDPASKKH